MSKLNEKTQSLVWYSNFNKVLVAGRPDADIIYCISPVAYVIQTCLRGDAIFVLFFPPKVTLHP